MFLRTISNMLVFHTGGTSFQVRKKLLIRFKAFPNVQLGIMCDCSQAESVFTLLGYENRQSQKIIAP